MGLARLGTEVEHPLPRLLDHGAVDPGEAVGRDLRAKLLAQLQVALRPQLQGRPLLGPQARAVGDVVLGDDEVLAEIILAPDDDVTVGMSGVVVVDGHPFEPRPQIGLHLGHHIASKAAQVRQPHAVLRRDDHAEGMPVALAALHEGLAVFPVALRAIELAPFAVASRAVPLKVAQMRPNGAAADAVADDTGLHHHPPLALAGAAFRRLPLQPIRYRLAATYSGAPSFPDPRPTWLAVGGLPSGQRAVVGLGRRFQYLGDKRPRPSCACSPTIADAAYAGTEISGVVSAHGGDVEPLILSEQGHTG